MTTRIRLLSVAASFLAQGALAPLPLAVGDDDTRTLTAEMLVDLSHVDDVALSPDGEAVAYTLVVPREADDEPGRSYSELWLARGDGDPRRFAGGKEGLTSPAWSPDGRILTFQVEREKEREGVQIYSIPADGGEARALTDHDGSVSSYAWAPDGKWIAQA